MLYFLDILLSVLHFTVLGFNLFGWTFKETRKAHLISILLTSGCWFFLGIWYGMGYCPLTDWQWRVKEELGERNLPDSFIKYYVDKSCGCYSNVDFITTITASGFITVVVLSLLLNAHDWLKKNSPAKARLLGK